MDRTRPRGLIGALLLVGLSCQPGAFRPLFVVGPSEAADFRSIQAALDAAPPEAILEIEPGIYRELVHISQPVTLQGLEKGRVVLHTDADRDPPWRAFDDQGRGGRQHPATSTLSIAGVGEGTVRLNRLVVSKDGNGRNAETRPVAAMSISDSKVIMTESVVTGSMGECMSIEGASDVQVSDCIVFGARETGISIARLTDDGRVRVRDSEIRNCRHRGISISGGAKRTSILRCRISGSSHGLRYDSSSPRISGNLFFDNYSADIYANGMTAARVEGNVFRGAGISCLEMNRDVIHHNTFVSDRPTRGSSHSGSGLWVHGRSDPRVERNVFFGFETAVQVSRDEEALEGTTMRASDVHCRDNLFWDVEQPIAWLRGRGDWTELPLREEDGNRIADPGFRDPAGMDFGWRQGALALEVLAGAPDPLGVPNGADLADPVMDELGVVVRRKFEMR